MRVLVANTFYAPQVVGGAELSVQGIAEQMAHQGHSVSVLTTGLRDQDELLNGVQVLRRRFTGLMAYGEHREAQASLKKIVNKPMTIDNPLNKRCILAAFDKACPDVVLSNNLLGITPELWRCARKRGIPVMHTVRDYALLCPNSTLICQHHSECGNKPLLTCLAMRLHLKKSCKQVHAVAAPSNYALSVHRKAGLFEHTEAYVIPNAVRFDKAGVQRAVKMREQHVPSDTLRLAYVGRLIEEKGVSDLLEAVARFEPGALELHLAGRGPLESFAQDVAASGQRVLLHGFLSQEEVDELLLSCDVLVAPSRYAETFGRVVLEGYRNAMPVIVSDAGALPEVLRPDTGEVIPAGNVNALVDAITRYSTNRARVVEQGVNGASALHAFTVEHQTNSFLAVLEKLVNHPNE